MPSSLSPSRPPALLLAPSPLSLSQQQQQREAREPAEGRSSSSGRSTATTTSTPRFGSFKRFFSRAVGLGKSEKKGGRSSLPAASASLPLPLLPEDAAASAGDPVSPSKKSPTGKHPMTLRDFAWFRMDTKRNLVVINTVLRLRGGPRPLGAEAVAEAVERRLLPGFPRLRQRVARSRARPHWRDDEGFDLSNHIRVEREERSDPSSSSSHSSSFIEDTVARLASAPLDRRRPLWELVILSPSPQPPPSEEVEEDEGRDTTKASATTVLLFRVHHCVTDGIGLMSVLERLLTTEAEGEGEDEVGRDAEVTATAAVPVPRLRPPAPSSPRPFLQFFGTLGSAARVAVAWPCGPRARNAFRAPAPLSGRKRFAWSSPPPLELERLRATAKRSGVTINDLFVAAASAALRSYFSLEAGVGEKGKRRGGDRVRAFVTFSLRHEKKTPAPSRLGNEFGLVAVDLPTHLGEPRERLRDASGRMSRLKESREPHGVAALLSLAGLAPGRRVQSYFLRVSSFF